MNRSLLIWFRRFRPEYGKKFRFHRALSEACSGLTYPITIQDSSYSSSFLGSFFGRGWYTIILISLFSIIGLFTVAMITLVLVPEKFSSLGLIVGFLFLGIVDILIVFGLYRRFGYIRFRDQNVKFEVQETLYSIKNGQHDNLLGVDVFKCEDSVWQDIVAASLTIVDIAIIDISEITENLSWEISETLKNLPQNRIIFVCEEKAFNDSLYQVNIKQFLSNLEPRIDVNLIQNKLFIFPSEQSGVGIKRRQQIRKYAQLLRTEIADRIL